VDGERDADGRVRLVDLDQRQREREVRQAGAAVFLGHQKAREPELAGLLDLRRGKLFLFVAFRGGRRAHALGVLARQLADGDLVVVQVEVHRS
jgi:hypothetical protein